MKRLYEIRHLVYLLVALAVVGCVRKEQLHPDGVYKQDALLYNVDISYKHTRELLDIIFKWEASLPGNVSGNLRPAMNKIREEAIKADQKFHRARTSYLTSPTAQSRQVYENALKDLNSSLINANELYINGGIK